MMNTKYLEEIKARCEKATTGEWKVMCQGNTVPSLQVVTETTWEHPAQVNVCSSISPKREADADFIAHSRTDIPELIAEAERLKTENATLKKALELACSDLLSAYTTPINPESVERYTKKIHPAGTGAGGREMSECKFAKSIPCSGFCEKAGYYCTVEQESNCKFKQKESIMTNGMYDSSDDIIKALEAMHNSEKFIRKADYWARCAGEAASILHRVASGELAEVVHAHWISDNSNPHQDPLIATAISMNIQFRCSHCGKNMIGSKSKRCNECGAIMDGKDDSHETD